MYSCIHSFFHSFIICYSLSHSGPIQLGRRGGGGQGKARKQDSNYLSIQCFFIVLIHLFIYSFNLAFFHSIICYSLYHSWPYMYIQQLGRTEVSMVSLKLNFIFDLDFHREHSPLALVALSVLERQPSCWLCVGI